MRVMVLQVLLIALAAGAAPTGATLLRPSAPRVLLVARGGNRSASDGGSHAQPALDSLVRAVAEAAPFRASRTLPAVAYNPDRTAAPAGSSASPQLKPQLVLSGVVWGGQAKPMAVLEGLPGIQGPRVVRVGERVGGLTLRRIQRDAVVVTGLDTMWTLTVKAPWK